MNLLNGALSSPRRRRLLATFISAVAVLGALVLAGWLAHWPSGVFAGSAASGAAVADTASAGASAPAGAVVAVTGLTSRNPATLRAALAAGYSVSSGDVAPAGTTNRVQQGTWRQQGDYATVRAVETLPGRSPLAETVYFAREEGRWRVLFADPS